MAYTFTITNLLKPDSLYNYGMQPVVYSDRRAELERVGCVVAGSIVGHFLLCLTETLYTGGTEQGITFVTFETGLELAELVLVGGISTMTRS